MNNKAKTTKDVLIAAKWILENVGWCQGTFTKYDMCPFNNKPIAFCLVGALSVVEVSDQPTDSSNPRANAIEIIKNTLAVIHLPSWNDAMGRTKENVLDILDKAIARA